MRKFKVITFTRNGEPDMRFIHEGEGDTKEAIVKKIVTEFAEQELTILGIRNYEDANEWIRICERLDPIEETKCGKELKKRQQKKVLKKWFDDYECGTGDSDPAAWFENHRNEIHQELSKAGFKDDVNGALKLMLDYYFNS